MKKGLILIGLIFWASATMAQTTIRKVPFLSYTGAAATYKTDSSGNLVRTNTAPATNQPFTGQPISKPYETIFFEADTNEIRKDQIKRLRKIAKRIQKDGGAFISFVGFATPDISNGQAQERVAAAVNALQDLGVQNTPVTSVEFKKHPVLNPNRVEVYMRAKDLGATIR